MKVESIDQRPRKSCVVAASQLGSTTTTPSWVSGVAAWARVHCGHHQRTCRKRGARSRSDDADTAVFERLPQGFQRAASELGKFVEEQDTVVSQADLAWPRYLTTAHQPRFADRMVRRSERPPIDHPPVRTDQSCDAMDLGCLYCFGVVQRW